MGLYDIVMVKCPNCGTKEEFQSKSGDCFLDVYELENCPDDVLWDVNRHSPYECSDCGILFQVDLKARKSVEVKGGDK